MSCLDLTQAFVQHWTQRCRNITITNIPSFNKKFHSYNCYIFQLFKRDFSATQSLQVTNVTPKGVVPFSIELRSIFYFRVEVFGQWILSSGLYGTALPKYIGMRSRKATGPSSTKQWHYEQINHHITSTAVIDFRVGFLDDQERCKCYRVLRNNYFEIFFL